MRDFTFPWYEPKTEATAKMSVGLNSTFVVKFGKSQVIQSDENGDISVLVKRADK